MSAALSAAAEGLATMMVIDAVLTKSRSTVGGCSGTSCGGGAPAVWVLSGEFAGRPGDPAQAVSTLKRGHARNCQRREAETQPARKLVHR